MDKAKSHDSKHQLKTSFNKPKKIIPSTADVQYINNILTDASNYCSTVI